MEFAFRDILSTKLSIPRARKDLVHRNRLIVRLEEGVNSAFVLISAPAGYGKTTLVLDWLRSKGAETEPHAVAWFSLDEGDNDAARFIRGLTAALIKAVPGIGDPVAAEIQSPQLPPLRTPLTMLINELVASSHEIILVLEDYQAIREPAIHEGLAFLLERLPPSLQVVVLTREDPPLRLPRLRARGTLCELRAADLRFTPEEAVRFFREVMRLPVSTDDAAALEARTEGWIAGLQLAALSMRAGEDASSFIAAFGRSQRHILEYLGEEVLAHQPGPIQTFLLRTSVLDQLNGPLCEAVLGDEQPKGGVHAILDLVERANLFLTPLDTERRWYRYHQLFADFLRGRLHETEPGLTSELHRRASQWYETHGLIREAIQHALAARDHDSAVRLVERDGMVVLHSGQGQTIIDWVRALPADAVETRPRLCVIYAYALFATNEGEAAEASLQAAERHLQSALSPAEAAIVRGRIAFLRAFMTVFFGDFMRGVALAAQALTLLPEADVEGRTLAGVIAQIGFLMTGDLTVHNERALAAAAKQAKTAGLGLGTRAALDALGLLHVLQGKLRRAAAVFIEAEKALGPHNIQAAPAYCFGFGDLLREWNDLARAESLLNQGMEAITETNSVERHVATQGYIALARLRQAQGDGSAALNVLDAFTVLARQRKYPPALLARAAAARAHLWLLQGNLVAAAHWAATSGLGSDDPVSYVRELEYLVFARVLIAQKNRATRALLDRALQDAEANGRMGSAIEILAVRALARHALADPAGALHDLERALALGEPEGYVRVFVDEGAPMATLLRRARARGLAPEYAARLLGAFVDRVAFTRPSDTDVSSSALTTPAERGDPNPLVERLTEREHEILRLLVTGASNKAIAQKLLVTTGTVKMHIHHIIGKLGVTNRAQAVAKAKALHLA